MNLQEYILTEIKEFSLESKVKSAQKLFKGLPLTHILVVQNNELLGCISENDLHTIEDNTTTIADCIDFIDFFHATNTVTILDLIKLFAENDCNIMPVVDKERRYLGYFDLSDILDIFTTSPFLYGDGAVLILEKQKKDFATSEVCQIVESNNAKVLGIYTSNETSDVIQTTLRIDTEDINEIIQTFRRYNYNIISEHHDDFYLQDLKDRSDYLQKYLNM